ncbi:MAG: hypothetical protein JSS49_17965 [Planctomycetes bacterium]|nr:hypothetical protein [Planctomycetota bacterium]
MTIRFECEFCGKTLKADDSKAGKKVKCPGCEGLLTIPAPPSEPEFYDDAAKDDDAEDWDAADSGTVTCPACGEEKPANKIKCPYCGEGGSKKKKKGGRRSSGARDRVQGPAIGLLVCAIIGGLIQAVAFVFQLAAGDKGPAEMAGVVVAGLLVAGSTTLVAIGALKMKNLTNYGLAMTASILAMIPCFSPCCLIGLPIGIWSLVVLGDASVKSKFD